MSISFYIRKTLQFYTTGLQQVPQAAMDVEEVVEDLM